MIEATKKELAEFALDVMAQLMDVTISSSRDVSKEEQVAAMTRMLGRSQRYLAQLEMLERQGSLDA